MGGGPAGADPILEQNASQPQREGVTLWPTTGSEHFNQPLANPPNDVQREQTKMSENPIRGDTAHIYCRASTKDLIRGLKRGGETYDETLRRLANQYDPEHGRRTEGHDGGN